MEELDKIKLTGLERLGKSKEELFDELYIFKMSERFSDYHKGCYISSILTDKETYMKEYISDTQFPFFYGGEEAAIYREAKIVFKEIYKRVCSRKMNKDTAIDCIISTIIQTYLSKYTFHDGRNNKLCFELMDAVEDETFISRCTGNKRYFTFFYPREDFFSKLESIAYNKVGARYLIDYLVAAIIYFFQNYHFVIFKEAEETKEATLQRIIESSEYKLAQKIFLSINSDEYVSLPSEQKKVEFLYELVK